MSKKHKKTQSNLARSKRQDSPAPSSARPSSSVAGSDAQRPRAGWLYAKRPVLGFVLLFAVLMGVFFGVTAIPTVDMDVIPQYMRFNADVSKVIINWFGEGAETKDTLISSSRFSVDIRHGCDAIAPTMLFVAAVLAFPASFGSKIPGVVIGALALAMINLIRIVALFFTGIYFPRAFEAMHVDVWQPVFILLALTFWVGWAWWATRAPVKQIHVPATTD
jgi:exosortase H (IPTLxxWG-CTERM-specific)